MSDWQSSTYESTKNNKELDSLLVYNTQHAVAHQFSKASLDRLRPIAITPYKNAHPVSLPALHRRTQRTDAGARFRSILSAGEKEMQHKNKDLPENAFTETEKK